jgi:hypothetical protein
MKSRDLYFKLTSVLEYLSSSSRVILIVPNSSLTCENRNFKTQSAFDVIIKESTGREALFIWSIEV